MVVFELLSQCDKLFGGSWLLNHIVLAVNYNLVFRSIFNVLNNTLLFASNIPLLLGPTADRVQLTVDKVVQNLIVIISKFESPNKQLGCLGFLVSDGYLDVFEFAREWIKYNCFYVIHQIKLFSHN